MKKYKLGTSPVGGVELLDELDIIRSVGFEGFHYGWVSHERQEAISNKAAQLGLFQQSIHSPFSGNNSVKALWDGGEKGDFVTNELIRCVEDCSKFDIPVMVIHPFIGFKDHTPTQIGLDNYARVIEVANKLGVKLGFENVEGEEYIAAIMKEFWNEPCVGFCLDTGHEMCYNEHRDMLALYGEKLCHTHLNDNLGVRGEAITFHDDLHLMPLDGIADWSNIMRRIEKTGYDGYIMSELSRYNAPGKNGTENRYGDLTTEEFHAVSIEKIKKAVAM